MHSGFVRTGSKILSGLTAVQGYYRARWLNYVELRIVSIVSSVEKSCNVQQQALLRMNIR